MSATTYSQITLPDPSALGWAVPPPGTVPVTLDVIATVDAGESCGWDTFTVLRHGTRFYTIDGSGCSCSTLFDDVFGLDWLDGPFTRFEVVERVKDWEARLGADGNPRTGYAHAAYVIGRVMDA